MKRLTDFIGSPKGRFISEAFIWGLLMYILNQIVIPLIPFFGKETPSTREYLITFPIWLSSGFLYKLITYPIEKSLKKKKKTAGNNPD